MLKHTSGAILFHSHVQGNERKRLNSKNWKNQKKEQKHKKSRSANLINTLNAACGKFDSLLSDKVEGTLRFTYQKYYEHGNRASTY